MGLASNRQLWVLNRAGRLALVDGAEPITTQEAGLVLEGVFAERAAADAASGTHGVADGVHMDAQTSPAQVGDPPSKRVTSSHERGRMSANPRGYGESGGI